MTTGAPTLQDAYCKWLGISEAQTPPDHYALLGLPQFEASQSKIQKAILERTKIVRPRSFKYHELGTQLLNEIAAAGVCLSDPKTKDEYDAALRTGGTVAALEVSRKTPQNQSRLREILEAAGRDDLLARADGKPTDGKSTNGKPAAPAASKPARPAVKPAEPDNLALAPVDPAVEAARNAGMSTAKPAGEASPPVATVPVATVPFAVSNDAHEMGQALLLAGGLAAAALIGIVIFVSWRMSSERPIAAVAESTSQDSGLPPPPPVVQSESTTLEAEAALTAFAAGNMGAPGYPGPSAADPKATGPDIKLHRYLGRIQRIECRGSKTHLILVPLAPHESAAAGPSPPNVEQLAWYGTLEAVADERDFHKKIPDYWSTEEVIDSKSGGEVVGYSSQTRNAGDAVEIYGAPLFENYPRPEKPTFTVKIQRLARLNDGPSTVAIGAPRDGWKQSDVAGRSVVDAMLRSVEGRNSSVTLTGITVNPILVDRVNARLTGNNRGMVFRFPSAMASMVGSRLGPGAGHELTIRGCFSGEYDDDAQPILEVLSVGYQSAPESVTVTPVPSPSPSSTAGYAPVPKSPTLSPESSVRPGTSRPVAPAESNERYYVVRYFDRFSKATYFEIAGSKEEREQTVKNLRADGLRPIAINKTFDSYEEASAYVDKEAAKANR